MHPTPERGSLSTRRLVVFLLVGMLLIVGGWSEDWQPFYFMIGVVVVVLNGSTLISRRWRRSR